MMMFWGSERCGQAFCQKGASSAARWTDSRLAGM